METMNAPDKVIAPGQITELAKLNLYQRINEVKKLVSYVMKTKRVGEGGYLAVTHDTVTADTRDHFIAQGVMILPTLVSSKVELTGSTTAKGISFIRYEASYRFDIVNADDPTDRFSLVMEAHALDQGDKAPGKCLSYAKKYVVLKLIELESGETEEDRQDQKPLAKSTPNAGAGDDLTAKQKQVIADTAIEMKDLLAAGKDYDAYAMGQNSKFDQEEYLFLWSQFDSKERAALKRMAKAENKPKAGSE